MILIQQRAEIKELDPNLWDASVGGHIDFDESNLKALIRETKEELGISLNINDNIKKLFVHNYNHPEESLKYFQHIYLLIKDIDLKDITLQKEEVKDIKYITLQEFKVLINNKDIFVEHEYYLKLIKEFEKTITNM